MEGKFNLYRAGMFFWAISCLLAVSGALSMSTHLVLSIVSILTAVSNFILGGLAVIYAELAKPVK